MSTKIEIPLNKAISALPIFILLILVVSGVLAFLSPELFVSKHVNPDTIRTKGIVAAGISLVLLIVFAIKLVTKKMGLIIDNVGITDFSNATFTELIEWEDIIGIKKIKNGPLKSIGIMTDKPNKYINKAKKTMRPYMQRAYNFHGSTLLIASSRLKMKHEDLFDLITKEFEKAKRTKT